CRRPCRTRNWRLDGTPAECWMDFEAREVASLQQEFALADLTAQHLVGRYGRRATDVARYLEHRPDLAARVVAGVPDMQVEFLYQRDEEMAVRPDDFLRRRTSLALVHPKSLDQYAIPQ